MERRGGNEFEREKIRSEGGKDMEIRKQNCF
jgi:hypothetical protein